jgi:hypothetical protein
MYQEKLDQARADLQHVSAVIAIYEVQESPDNRSYVNIDHLFKRQELAALCREALSGGPLDTKAIAAAVLKRKGFDDTDPVLVRTVAKRIIRNLMVELRRGKLMDGGRRAKYRIWALPGQGEAALPL